MSEVQSVVMCHAILTPTQGEADHELGKYNFHYILVSFIPTKYCCIFLGRGVQNLGKGLRGKLRSFKRHSA
jgi:hypothetical protein